MINKLLARTGESIYEGYLVSDFDLASFRLTYCLFFMFIVGLPVLGWIPFQAEILFNPPLFLSLFVESAPGTTFFFVLSVCISLAFCGLLLGFRTRLSSYMLSAFLLIAYAFYYSFGKIDHNILLVISPLVMARSGWGNQLSLDSYYRKPIENRHHNTNALFNLALLIGFAFFTAGIAKAHSGWLDMENLATRGQWYQNYFGRERVSFLANVFLKLEARWLWKFFDFSVVFFECGFLLAVIKRRFFQGFLILACFFHLSIMLFFNISFLANLAVYLAFVPWAYWLNKMKTKVDFVKWKAWVVGGVVVFVLSWNSCFFTPQWANLTGNSTAPLSLLLSTLTDQPQFYMVVLFNGLVGCLLWSKWNG